MNDSTSSDPTFNPANDPFQSAKASALKAAEELRAAAMQKANDLRDAATQRAQQFRSSAEQKAGEFREKAEEFRHYADEAVDSARERYQNVMSEAEKLTREKPRQALLTAFGVGILVGLILRR